MQDVLMRAKALETRAGEVIKDLGIRDLWEAVGRTCLVGSARFGLMVQPNIDFETYVETPEPQAGFAIMSRMAEFPGVTQCSYVNFIGTDDPGLYWHFDYVDESGTEWDFDNWLIPFSHPNAGMAEAFAAAMSAALTDETRTAILRLKRELRQTPPSPATPQVRGIDIYKAVLRDGVADAAAFRAWLAENPPPPLETWHP